MFIKKTCVCLYMPWRDHAAEQVTGWPVVKEKKTTPSNTLLTIRINPNQKFLFKRVKSYRLKDFKKHSFLMQINHAYGQL